MYKNGTAISFDEDHGFTYYEVTQTVSLHGDASPLSGEPFPDYKVYAVNPSALAIDVPAGSYVFDSQT